MRKERTCGVEGVMAAMKFAELRRPGTRNVNFFTSHGAVGCGEFEGVGINDVGIDALRLVPVPDIAVAGQRGGANHEVSPDGGRGGASSKAEIVVVVEADPNDANEVAGKSGEPAVAGGASFPCGGESK